MDITSRFPSDIANKILKRVYKIVLSEKGLTKRGISETEKLIKNGNLFVAFDGKQIAGFVAKAKITKNYFEIRSLFVNPKFRGCGLGKSLLRAATADKSQNFIASTFDGRVVNVAKSVGFSVNTYRFLPSIVTAKFILGKNINSVIRHLFKERSYLLVKHGI